VRTAGLWLGLHSDGCHVLEDDIRELKMTKGESLAASDNIEQLVQAAYPY